MYSCEILEIFKNTFTLQTPPVAASAYHYFQKSDVM